MKINMTPLTQQEKEERMLKILQDNPKLADELWIRLNDPNDPIFGTKAQIEKKAAQSLTVGELETVLSKIKNKDALVLVCDSDPSPDFDNAVREFDGPWVTFILKAKRTGMMGLHPLTCGCLVSFNCTKTIQDSL